MNSKQLQFGEFVLDCARYELRKGVNSIKLETIPMELLILLTTSEGRLVTRAEIEERIWGNGVFVDAEHGINTAVRKVRQALADNPDEPRFIQTVQRKGYRFVADVKWIAAVAPAVEEASTGKGDTAAAIYSAGDEKRKYRKNHVALWMTAAVVAIAAWPIAKFVSPRLTRAEKTPAIQSIAVLPLENISGDRQQDFFADGMTDELITMLAQYPSLRVISRTSVMQYKGVHRPLPEIAKELGVDGIIEGTISRGNGKVLVRAQLIYAPKDTHLWAESFERDAGGVLTLQQELAQNIAERVNRAAWLPSRSAATSHPATNQAAHDAYYRGRSFWSAGQYDKSEKYFREAIQLDPSYGAAYAGISDSYTAAAVSGGIQPSKAMPKAREAIQKALELNPESAEVHHANAAVKLFFDWDWEAAEREMQHSLSLNPGIAEAHHLHSYILEAANRTEEALQEDKLCTQLDPFGRWWSYGFALYRNRKFAEAITEFRQRGELVPSDGLAHALMGMSYEQMGDGSRATEEWKQQYEVQKQSEMAKHFEDAFRSGGFAAVKELRYRRTKENAKKGNASNLELAETAAQAGHKEESLEYLERAFEDHVPLMVRLLHDPELDVLHDEPRFKALVKKIGLPGAD